MLAIGNAVFSYLGSDCGAHMCEEIPNPGKNVPKVILFPLVIGFLTAFPFAAALMYSIVDIEAVFNTATGLPLLEIYYQGTGSKAAASALLALFAFCFFGCLVANGRLTSKDSSLLMPGLIFYPSDHIIQDSLGCFERRCFTIFPYLGSSSSSLQDAMQRDAFVRNVHYSKQLSSKMYSEISVI